MAAKKPSGVRTGTHSAGGRKRYTDVKRRTTRVPSADQLLNEQIGVIVGGRPGGESIADWKRERSRLDRLEAAKANKRKSTTSGRYHSGSAIRNAADVSMNNPLGF